MRAIPPVRSGFADRDGVAIHYDVYGEGEPTVHLLTPNTIVQSEAWKAQVPFLARSFRVVVSDPRGNGLSDAPTSTHDYAERARIDDGWAVLDAIGAEEAVLVGLCLGADYALTMAAERPERVRGVVGINPAMALADQSAHRVEFDFTERRDSYTGWQKENRHHWLEDWPDYARFFFDEMFPEPHSLKQREDCVGWALGAGPETMLLARTSASCIRGREAATCEAVRCPVLVITGSQDRCQNPARGRAVAEHTGGDLVVIDGGGHLPQARDPVKVNLLLRDFVRRLPGTVPVR